MLWRSNAGCSFNGGNKPKLTFIGWNDGGPASIVSIWPPVMWVSSAPCAVVGGGKETGSSRRSAAAKRPASKPDSGRLDITLAAGDLAGEPPTDIRLEP